MVHLRDWLERHREELVAAGEELPRRVPADGGPSEELDERQQRVHALIVRLLRGVPEQREERSDKQQACWLLFEPECRTPHQMRLANAFCRYLERATVWH